MVTFMNHSTTQGSFNSLLMMEKSSALSQILIIWEQQLILISFCNVLFVLCVFEVNKCRYRLKRTERQSQTQADR